LIHFLDQYTAMKETIQVAEEAELQFTKGLLLLEEKLISLEKDTYAIRKVYKQLTKELKLLEKLL